MKRKKKNTSISAKKEEEESSKEIFSGLRERKQEKNIPKQSRERDIRLKRYWNIDSKTAGAERSERNPDIPFHFLSCAQSAEEEEILENVVIIMSVLEKKNMKSRIMSTYNKFSADFGHNQAESQQV